MESLRRYMESVYVSGDSGFTKIVSVRVSYSLNIPVMSYQWEVRKIVFFGGILKCLATDSHHFVVTWEVSIGLSCGIIESNGIRICRVEVGLVFGHMLKCAFEVGHEFVLDASHAKTSQQISSLMQPSEPSA